MVFSIIDAMTDGFSRTIERNGLVFVAVFVVLALLNALVVSVGFGSAADTSPVSALVGAVSGLLSIALGLVMIATAVIALRTFASDETETIPREFRSRKIAFATLNVFVGTFVFALLVAVGSVFLLVPGLFLLVSLYYWTVFVAVEDENFVRAFRSSWTLTSGSRLRLFGLGVAVLVAGLAVNGAAALPAVLLGDAAGFVLAQLVAAVVTVYTVATTARAYDQLRGLEHPPDAEPQPGSAGTPA
ncbi:hypothetical protein [Natrinema salaciae]|uniref:DUF7847 domain-containing protein n=1 Tax=Natrinema salaciae TaxID=1186196 RepID=A0A1H9LEI6_9EURY|nr:hypothetical protein [Natrinema salaciae]SER09901.1 hypothetical protein SAMN04489841_2945 [Natrinema salaciae]